MENLVIKAVFIIRRDLEMSSTKLGIQIGHGTDFIHLASSHDLSLKDWHRQHNPYYGKWLTEFDRRKIVVAAKTEKKLTNIAKMLDETDILYDLIYDKGYTEFGKETLTGLVIHPIDETHLPKAVQKLRLL